MGGARHATLVARAPRARGAGSAEPGQRAARVEHGWLDRSGSVAVGYGFSGLAAGCCIDLVGPKLLPGWLLSKAFGRWMIFV